MKTFKATLIIYLTIALVFTGLGYAWRMHHEGNYTKQTIYLERG